jgi:hypothetical protein
VRKLGLDDEGVLELMAVVDVFAGLNKLLDGLRVEIVVRVRLAPGMPCAFLAVANREGAAVDMTWA